MFKKISLLFLLLLFLFPVTIYGSETDITDRIGTGDAKIGVTSDDIVVVDLGENDKTEAWNNIYSKLHIFLLGVTGLGTLASVGFLIVYILRFTAAGNNPQERRGAISGFLYSGVALSILGSSTLFLAFAWGFFKI